MNDATGKEGTGGTPPQASPEENAGGQPQASPETQAEPDIVVVDPLKQYQFGEGDDAFSVSGLDVRQGLGRGAMAQRLQSERDTAISRNDQLESALDGSQEQIVELQQTLARIQQRDEIAQQVKEQLPAASPQPSADDEGWSTEGQPVQQPVDPDVIAQRIADTGKDMFQGITAQNFVKQEDLVAAVAEVMKQQSEQRAIQDNANQWANERFDSRVESFENDYGFTKQEANDLARVYDTAKLHESYGSAAAARGETQVAAQHFDDGDALTLAASKRVAAQMVKHADELQVQELEKSVAAGQFDGLPAAAEEGVDLTKPNKFWTDRRAHKEWREAKKAQGEANMTKANAAQVALNAAQERLLTR